MKNPAFPSCMLGNPLQIKTLDGDDAYCMETLQTLFSDLSSETSASTNKPFVMMMQVRGEAYDGIFDSPDCSTTIELTSYELKIPKLTTAQREVLALFTKKNIVHADEVPRNRVSSMQVLQQKGLVRAIANKGTELHMNNYARKLLIAHYFGS